LRRKKSIYDAKRQDLTKSRRFAAQKTKTKLSRAFLRRKNLGLNRVAPALGLKNAFLFNFFAPFLQNL
jgi:NAD-dependent DNA ligase